MVRLNPGSFSNEKGNGDDDSDGKFHGKKVKDHRGNKGGKMIKGKVKDGGFGWQIGFAFQDDVWHDGDAGKAKERGNGWPRKGGGKKGKGEKEWKGKKGLELLVDR